MRGEYLVDAREGVRGRLVVRALVALCVFAVIGYEGASIVPRLLGYGGSSRPSIVVRQIVEPTPKTRPWYAPSACWWIAVIITTSVNPLATPKATRRRIAATAPPDQANAKKSAPIAASPAPSQRGSIRSAIAPVIASPAIIPQPIAASAEP